MPFELVHSCEFLRSDVEKLFKGFLRKACAGEIETILSEMDPNRHYAVSIHALELIAHNMVLGELLIHNPVSTLDMFDSAIVDYQHELLEAFRDQQDTLAYSAIVKPFAHARVHSLPRCDDLFKPTISCIRTEDVGHLMSIAGTVTRTAAVRMLHAERKVECVKCGKEHRVRADLERFNEMVLPSECGNEKGTGRCTSSKFANVEGTEVCRDYQEIRVQEQVQKLGIGAIPRSITVVLEDDIVDGAKPGDDVLVTGVIVRRWKPLRADARPDVELVFRANHITVCNQLVGAGLVTNEACTQFEEFWATYPPGLARVAGRDLLLRAICPGLNGLFLVKLALALCLLGGVCRTDPSGQRIRGESHLLLVGDPGTGKSQVLKFTTSLCSRSVMTTGVGSTSAGLTVTANKDATGEWSLDAGALVLADGGVCCIDEFGTMREHDRTTIHEAMEQQTLSVAKAGLVCKLRAKTTIIAATNPKDRRQRSSSLTSHVGIAAPLLSRFDVVLLLSDDMDEEWDESIAEFILQRDCEPRDPPKGAEAAADDPAQVEGTTRTVHGVPEEVLWSEDTLRAYIECARRRFEPTMTPEAERILSRYFERQRQAEHRNAARTTVRLLESLIRLAQAHARLMWRNSVETIDAVYAIVLIEAGADPGVDGPLRSGPGEGMSVCRSDFPHPGASAVEAKDLEDRILEWLELGPDAGDSRPCVSHMPRASALVEATAPDDGDGEDPGTGGSAAVASALAAGHRSREPVARVLDVHDSRVEGRAEGCSSARNAVDTCWNAPLTAAPLAREPGQVGSQGIPACSLAADPWHQAYAKDPWVTDSF